MAASRQRGVRVDWFECTRQSGHWFFANMRGQLRLGRTMPADEQGNPLALNPPPYGWAHWTGESCYTERAPGSDLYVWGAGFGLVTGERWQQYHQEAMLPHWFVLVGTGVIPGVWLWAGARQRRANQRVARGLCPNCGYNLRASPGRCRECGRPVPTRT